MKYKITTACKSWRGKNPLFLHESREMKLLFCFTDDERIRITKVTLPSCTDSKRILSNRIRRLYPQYSPATSVTICLRTKSILLPKTKGNTNNQPKEFLYPWGLHFKNVGPVIVENTYLWTHRLEMRLSQITFELYNSVLWGFSASPSGVWKSQR